MTVTMMKMVNSRISSVGMISFTSGHRENLSRSSFTFVVCFLIWIIKQCLPYVFIFMCYGEYMTCPQWQQMDLLGKNIYVVISSFKGHLRHFKCQFQVGSGSICLDNFHVISTDKTSTDFDLVTWCFYQCWDLFCCLHLRWIFCPGEPETYLHT